MRRHIVCTKQNNTISIELLLVFLPVHVIETQVARRDVLAHPCRFVLHVADQKGTNVRQRHVVRALVDVPIHLEIPAKTIQSVRQRMQTTKKHPTDQTRTSTASWASLGPALRPMVPMVPMVPTQMRLAQQAPESCQPGNKNVEFRSSSFFVLDLFQIP